jgi:hypothetical protein
MYTLDMLTQDFHGIRDCMADGFIEIKCLGWKGHDSKMFGENIDQERSTKASSIHFLIQTMPVDILIQTKTNLHPHVCLEYSYSME